MITDIYTHPWQATIQDIAVKIEIRSGWVSHADFPNSAPDADVIACFEQLPIALQNQFFHSELSHLIYGIYFSGALRPVKSDRTLTNNTARGVDTQFFDRLHESNCGKGYFDPEWTVCDRTSDFWLVQKSGLTLHIKPDRHLANDQTEDQVSILLPPNLIDDDYYVAISDCGDIDDSPVVQYYFAIAADDAASLMADVTESLNQLGIPFNFKLLFRPEDYYRYDAGILTLNQQVDISDRLKILYAKHQFRDQTPAFTQQLFPGLSCSESEKPDFGMACCRAIAQGLLKAYQQNNETVANRLTEMKHSLALKISTEASDSV